MSTPSQVESIFLDALGKTTTADRADYLDDACGGDAELAVRWNGSCRPMPRRRISWPGLPSSVSRTTQLTVSPTHPDYDPTPTRPVTSSPPVPSARMAHQPARHPTPTRPVTSTPPVRSVRVAPQQARHTAPKRRVSSTATLWSAQKDSAKTRTGPGRWAVSPLPPPLPARRPDSSHASRPKISGYEILGKLGRGRDGRRLQGPADGPESPGGPQDDHRREPGAANITWPASGSRPRRSPGSITRTSCRFTTSVKSTACRTWRWSSLEGGSLAHRSGRHAPAGPAAAELVATLARAIHAAHQARIVHRDLKPANVPLRRRRRTQDHRLRAGQAAGIRRSPDAERRHHGHAQLHGPRAGRGTHQGRRAGGGRLRAWGDPVRVLTGRPPFKGETTMETVRQVINTNPVPPSRLVPRLARDLETICLKCLHKDPQKRYSTAEELAKDLDRYREGKPINARPTSLWEHGLKWSKRRPAAALAVAVSLLAFFGLTVGIIFYLERRTAWVDQQQNGVVVLLDEADRASTTVALENVQVELAKFLQLTKDEPRLKLIWDRVEEKRKWVDDQLEAQSSRHAAQQRDREDRERFAKFLELRQEAQLYAANFGVLVQADRLEKLRAAAHAALSTYAQDPARGRRRLDASGVVAGRVVGYREGSSEGQLLRLAVDPVAGGGRAGRGTADPRPRGPAAPGSDGRIPSPPRRVPRARGRPRGPGPRESRSQPDQARDRAGFLPQRSRAGPSPPVR